MFEVAQLFDLVLTQDVLAVRGNQRRHKAAERRDAVPLADAEHRGVNVGGPSFGSDVGVRDSTSRVVMEVRLDVAAHDFAQGVDLLENFPRRGTAHGIGDAYAVRAQPIDERVQLQYLSEIRAEGVFPGEANLNLVRFDIFDDLLGFGSNVGHVLSVGMFHEVGRSANAHIAVSGPSVMDTWFWRDDIHSIDACLNGDPCVFHIASDVTQYLTHC
jgi:hypothetical protein